MLGEIINSRANLSCNFILSTKNIKDKIKTICLRIYLDKNEKIG